MSRHFSVMVIGDKPDDELAPFDEGLEMPPYILYTKNQLITKGKAEIDDFKTSTYLPYLAHKDAYKASGLPADYLEFLDVEFPKWIAYTDDQIHQSQLHRFSPINISPQGDVYATYNPQAKWSYYQLGGRWSGSLKLKSGVSVRLEPALSHALSKPSPPPVPSDSHSDQALKKDIDNWDSLTPNAFLTHGLWYEPGPEGKWGVVQPASAIPKYVLTLAQLKSTVPDSALVSLFDCRMATVQTDAF